MDVSLNPFEDELTVGVPEGNPVHVPAAGLYDYGVAGKDMNRIPTELAGNLVFAVDKVPITLDIEGTPITLIHIHGLPLQGASYQTRKTFVHNHGHTLPSSQK